MASCECLPKCPFFNGKMAGFLPKAAELMKQRLCLGDPSGCARYAVFKKLGSANIPLDLIPNQMDRVEGIITAAGKKTD